MILRFALFMSFLLLIATAFTGCTMPGEIDPKIQAQACGDQLHRMFVGQAEADMIHCYLGLQYTRPIRTTVVGSEEHRFYLDRTRPGTALIMVVNGRVAGWTGGL